MYNVRDLGGLPTADGGLTRFGAVVRSDNPRRLTEAGVAALRAHGVRSVVDLTDPLEAEREGPAAELGLERYAVSVLDLGDDEFFSRWLGVYDAVGFYREALERFAPRWAEAVAAIGRARPGVLVHCQVGRDRTGMTCALALSLAEVVPEAIAEDYALSAERLRPLYDDWIAAEPDPELRSRLERQNVSDAAAMLEVLRGLDVRAFLLEGGADPRDLEAVRAKLV
jgi:protein tyrosine/serine phosphatase